MITELIGLVIYLAIIFASAVDFERFAGVWKDDRGRFMSHAEILRAKLGLTLRHE